MPTNRLSVFDHFVKLALQACNFIKKETLALVFACEFCAISKNTYSTEYLRTTTSSLVPCVRYFPVNFAKLLRTLFLTEYLQTTASDLCTSISKKYQYLFNTFVDFGSIGTIYLWSKRDKNECDANQIKPVEWRRFLRRYSNRDVFLWILRIFKKSFLYRTPPVAVSDAK